MVLSILKNPMVAAAHQVEIKQAVGEVGKCNWSRFAFEAAEVVKYAGFKVPYQVVGANKYENEFNSVKIVDNKRNQTHSIHATFNGSAARLIASTRNNSLTLIVNRPGETDVAAKKLHVGEDGVVGDVDVEMAKVLFEILNPLSELPYIKGAFPPGKTDAEPSWGIYYPAFNACLKSFSPE